MTNRSRRNKEPQKTVIKSVSEIAGSPGKTTIAPYKETKYNTKEVEKIVVPWGDDNLFPQSVAYLLRKSGIQRGIINSQVTYLTGKKFACEDSKLEEFIKECNGEESLRSVSKKFFLDYKSQGNAFFQIVTDAKRSFVSLYHIDVTECRVGRKDYEGKIVMHPNWADYNNNKTLIKAVPIFPEFEQDEETGQMVSMVHVKDYEPEFRHYGTPDWLSGLDAASIAYKTNRWNISRLDNGAKPGGILFVDAEFETDELRDEFKSRVAEVYEGEGNQGKMLTVTRSVAPDQKDGTQFIQFNDTTDADWKDLKGLAIEEMLVANNWMATLSGIQTSSGFDTSRILNEYQIALNNNIQPTQEVFLEVIDKIGKEFGIDTETLEFVNKPPLVVKSDDMMVWESRKEDGRDYDENDPRQQMYLAELKSNKSYQDEGNAITKFFKNLIK